MRFFQRSTEVGQPAPATFSFELPSKIESLRVAPPAPLILRDGAEATEGK
jgi:hypothetical protein